MTSKFEVVAEPARREILDLLLQAQRPVGEIATATGLSQPNTSRHLRILRDAGLVERRSEGQRRLYRVRAEGFGELAAWLAPYVRMLAPARPGPAATARRQDPDEPPPAR